MMKYMFALATERNIPAFDLLGGAGNRSIHEAVKHGLFEILEVVLELDPGLCHCEDMFGNTAFEVGKELVKEAIRASHRAQLADLRAFLPRCEKEANKRRDISPQQVKDTTNSLFPLPRITGT
ncbi:ankyrin repeat protein [Penicillium frequentans]|nr:ankyrin repeat protein [Penicillium glabrum]